MTTDRADQAIVRSTVNMAHSLGIRVVAEGVEDQETWSLPGSLRCDIAQGYYLSRPVAAHDLECWLEERLGSSPSVAEAGLGSATAMAAV